jgi:hypothetical protein
MFPCNRVQRGISFNAEQGGIAGAGKAGKEAFKPVTEKGGGAQIQGPVSYGNGIGNFFRFSGGVYAGKQGLSVVGKTPVHSSLFQNWLFYHKLW